MYQTQWMLMTQKAILQAIWKHLLAIVAGKKEKLWTLATEFCNRNYWVTGPSQSSPRRCIIGWTIGLRLVVGILIRLWHLQQRKSSRTRHAAARSSARVNWTPRHVSRPGRDSSTLGDTFIYVSSPWDKSPVIIGGNVVSSACGISGSLQVGNKLQSPSPEKIKNTQKLDTSVDSKNKHFRAVYRACTYLYLFFKINNLH